MSKIKNILEKLDIEPELEVVFNELIDMEGGYVNDPDDPGGETNWGITIDTARRFGYNSDMKDLTLKEAIEIYYRAYWLKNKYDQIDSIKLAKEVFEQSVNYWSDANEYLQESYNLLNPDEHITVDGIIGPNTLKAINSEDPERLFLVMNALQARHYIELTERNPVQSKYLYGRLRTRVFNF